MHFATKLQGNQRLSTPFTFRTSSPAPCSGQSGSVAQVINSVLQHGAEARMRIKFLEPPALYCIHQVFSIGTFLAQTVREAQQ